LACGTYRGGGDSQAVSRAYGGEIPADYQEEDLQEAEDVLAGALEGRQVGSQPEFESAALGQRRLGLVQHFVQQLVDRIPAQCGFLDGLSQLLTMADGFCSLLGQGLHVLIKSCLANRGQQLLRLVQDPGEGCLKTCGKRRETLHHRELAIGFAEAPLQDVDGVFLNCVSGQVADESHSPLIAAP
jgi:hypothetical protein